MVFALPAWHFDRVAFSRAHSSCPASQFPDATQESRDDLRDADHCAGVSQCNQPGRSMHIYPHSADLVDLGTACAVL